MSAGLFVLTLLVVNAVVAATPAPLLSRIGHDFLPFYAAGSLVREGGSSDVYDLDALRAREQLIARENELLLGTRDFGPFWNPPFYALPFAPLSALPYHAALFTWLAINLLALAAAMALLCRIVGAEGWRNWGVVPLLVVASTPFLMAVTHGQNTFGSLLLLTIAVVAWRARQAALAGIAIGLLAYKPQLAAVCAVVAVIDLGWKAFAGAALSGGSLVLSAALAMPGSIADYVRRLPGILHAMQVEQPYLWERHVTLKAFWRLLVQGYAPGEADLLVTLLTVACAAPLGIALLVAAVRVRSLQDPARRDTLIAATVACMPLVMPFYFDYDLLLLAVPAVLIAAGRQPAGRFLLITWSALYLWLIINPDVAERTRVNLAVPLLCVLAGMLTARALRRDAETAQCTPVAGGIGPAPTTSRPKAA